LLGFCNSTKLYRDGLECYKRIQEYGDETTDPTKPPTRPAPARSRTKDETLNEAYVEHDGAKVIIAELQAADPNERFNDAKVKVLSELIKHHVKEEERCSEGMFAQARSAGVAVDELGLRMVARKKELLAKFKASGLPPPITRAFTGHELTQALPIEEAATD